MTGKVIEDIKNLKNCEGLSFWAKLYEINKDHLCDIAIEYRGRKITYGEMFQRVDEYAMSLRAMKIGYQSEILACMSNTPELIYLLLAASKVGAIFNSIGDYFDRDYLHEIIAESDAKTLFLTDDHFKDLEAVINGSTELENLVTFSLADSLPIKNGRAVNLFEEIDAKYKSFTNLFLECRNACNKNIIWQERFIYLGEEYARDKYGVIRTSDPIKFRDLTNNKDIAMTDTFLVTYESDIDTKRPEKKIHMVQSLLLLASHRPYEIKDVKTANNMRVLAHIPAYTYRGLCASLIDGLSRGGTVIAEPIYDIDHFTDSMILNRPNMVPASPIYWKKACLELLFDKKYRKVRIPSLYLPVVDGPMTAGEEQLFNETAKKKRFGMDDLYTTTTFSLEESLDSFKGIFFQSFRSIEKNSQLDLAMRRYKTAKNRSVEILDSTGYPTAVGEWGEITVDLADTTEDTHNSSAIREDIFGIFHERTNLLGVKVDDYGHIDIKGTVDEVVELPDGKVFPLFFLEEIVGRDYKNVLSVKAVKVCSGDGIDIVIHVEPQPLKRIIKGKKELLKSIVKRLHESIPSAIADVLYLKIYSNSDAMPISRDGSLDKEILASTGITDSTISYAEIRELLEDDAKTFMLQPK